MGVTQESEVEGERSSEREGERKSFTSFSLRATRLDGLIDFEPLSLASFAST